MTSPDWPALPFTDWESTCDTLHMWTQIVGKTRLALTPLENHWWNVPLYVTSRGLGTSAIPHGQETFEVEFDLIGHRLLILTSGGQQHSFGLFPRSVADFYTEYMACIHSLGIDVKIHTTPVEFDDNTPFEQDRHHASYDRDYVERFRRILIQSDLLFKTFRARFVGKSSPVHFFWGSFDLAVTRFSGRRAPERDVDAVTKEAYSHEAISCGFWPGNRVFPNAAFYSYTAPSPAGLEAGSVQPRAAYWDKGLGEFILKYEDARLAASPGDAVLDFCQSTYEAGATLAHWDRVSLERAAG